MRLIAIISTALALAAASPALAVDWMFAPSTYTHDPQTAQRVSQYAEPKPVYVHHAPDYRRSGYRHNTSVNGVGRNADRLHIVEEWGRQVRPYGEWLRPYRPYSVPYDLWGPPFGGLGPGYGRFGPGFPRPWLGPNPPRPRPTPFDDGIRFPPRRLDDGAAADEDDDVDTTTAERIIFPPVEDRDDEALGPIAQGAT